MYLANSVALSFLFLVLSTGWICDALSKNNIGKAYFCAVIATICNIVSVSFSLHFLFG